MTGGIGIGLGGFALDAIASAPMLWLNPNSENNRVLVLIRLKGGNDGLNTIIPKFDYGLYKTNRPTISIKEQDLVSLDSAGAFAMPKSLSKLKPLWNEGAMKIINSVGYPNHNLSHFTSSDIMATSNTQITIDNDKSGWLGRYLLDQNPDYLENLPTIPGAIKISSSSNITFQSPDRIDLAVNFNTPQRLIDVAEKGLYFDTNNLPDDCYYGQQVGYLRSILNVTYKYAPNIRDAYQSSTNGVAFSNNELSRQLSIVSRLVKGNLGTKLYMVTLDGFDTHENQIPNHERLMNYVSSAVSEFYSDLKLANKDSDVLAMTFSEFGRRIKENEGGTDHGNAAPVMLFGNALNGNGILGENPDMRDLDQNGNLKHDVDFRSVYASLMEDWLCVAPAVVDNLLGNTFERVGPLGFDCLNVVGTQDQATLNMVTQKAKMNGDGSYTIEYNLERPGPVIVSIFTIMGQKVDTLINEYQSAGKHETIFVNRHHSLSSAIYVYNIQVAGKMFSGKFMVSN